MVGKTKDSMDSSSKIDLFGSDRASSSKIETKPRAMNSNDLTLDMMVTLNEDD